MTMPWFVRHAGVLHVHEFHVSGLANLPKQRYPASHNDEMADRHYIGRCACGVKEKRRGSIWKLIAAGKLPYVHVPYRAVFDSLHIGTPEPHGPLPFGDPDGGTR